MKYFLSLVIVGAVSCVAMADPCQAVTSTRVVQVAQPQYVQTVAVAQPVYVQRVAVANHNQVVAVGNGYNYGYNNVVAVNQFRSNRFGGQRFGSGRFGNGGGGNVLNTLLSRQSVLSIAGAAGGAAIAGPLGAGLGSALGNIIGGN